MRGFGSVPTKAHNDSMKLEELFDMFDLKTATKSFVALRFMPYPMLPVRRHWISILTKDGKKVRVPKMCLNFDPDDESSDDGIVDRKCPYCKLQHGSEKDGASASYEMFLLANVLVRDLQENGRFGKVTPQEKKTGIKDLDSKSNTPIRVIRLPGGVAKRLKDMAELNKGFEVNHPKKGIDVLIKFDPKAANASDMYKVERGEPSPIEEDEMGYLRYDLDDAGAIYDLLGRTNLKDALAEFKTMKVVGARTDDEDDEEEDDDNVGAKKRKPSRSRQKPWEEEEDEDEDDDEPTRKSGSRNKRGKPVPDEDEDEDGDEDDDDLPRGRGRAKPARNSKRRPVEDDEDDEEDDDDEPVRSRRPASKAKPKSRFADDDDDDEDDEPPRSKRAPAKSKRRPVEDDEDEDDEDDEPVRRKRPAQRSSRR